MHCSIDDIDIHSKKSNIRKSIIHELKEFQYKESESLKIVERLSERKDFKKASTILAFYPLSTEPDITPLFEDERIAFPFIEKGRMFFSNTRPLKKNALGFLEPQHNIISFDNALMLVPLIAFDDSAYRLGRGGGFYDRYIKENRGRIYTLGIAFSISKIDKIPTEPFDQKLDEILYIKG